MKNNDCFNCLFHGKGEMAENTGWYHSCKKGIYNEEVHDAKKCDSYGMNTGFQIGGYYSFIHFEKSGECLEMYIHSNGDFPRDNKEEFIQFHICDFEQVENCIKEWGKHLRELKIIPKKGGNK